MKIDKRPVIAGPIKDIGSSPLMIDVQMNIGDKVTRMIHGRACAREISYPTDLVM